MGAAIRMACISKLPALYVGTHDSIEVGEDGPTHQPVELLPQLRAMPGLLVIRPATVDEMVGTFDVYAEQVNETKRPVFIMTSRGELGLPYQENSMINGREGVKRGAYVVHESFEPEDPHGLKQIPDIVLIGSGQDVALCMRAKQLLLNQTKDQKGTSQIKIRVVSMPCWELFEEQEQEYKDSVLFSNHANVLRVYVEKAATANTGHEKYAHLSIVMP